MKIAHAFGCTTYLTWDGDEFSWCTDNHINEWPLLQDDIIDTYDPELGWASGNV